MSRDKSMAASLLPFQFRCHGVNILQNLEGYFIKSVTDCLQYRANKTPGGVSSRAAADTGLLPPALSQSTSINAVPSQSINARHSGCQ